MVKSDNGKQKRKLRKTGIMGGTFNPIHLGHLLLAETARDAFGLDEVLFVPSGCPYMKDRSTLLPGCVRADMTGLAIAGNPYFRLSLLEVDRRGDTYTFETIETLRAQDGLTQYYFIVGADCLFTMDTWKRPEIIFAGCVILAAVRNEKTPEDMLRQIHALETRYGARIHLLPMEGFDLSSTGVRDRIREGKSVRYMVPDSVISYIEENQLYKFPAI